MNFSLRSSCPSSSRISIYPGFSPPTLAVVIPARTLAAEAAATPAKPTCVGSTDLVILSRRRRISGSVRRFFTPLHSVQNDIIWRGALRPWQPAKAGFVVVAAISIARVSGG